MRDSPLKGSGVGDWRSTRRMTGCNGITLVLLKESEGRKKWPIASRQSRDDYRRLTRE